MFDSTAYFDGSQVTGILMVRDQLISRDPYRVIPAGDSPTVYILGIALLCVYTGGVSTSDIPVSIVGGIIYNFQILLASNNSNLLKILYNTHVHVHFIFMFMLEFMCF